MTVRPALLHPTYWPEVRRGAERMVHDLGVGLARRGHQPLVITSHPGRPAAGVEDGIDVRRVWRPPGEPLLRRRAIQPNLAHLPFTYAELVRTGPDLAHAFTQTETIPALRWGRRTGRPVLLTFTGLVRRQSLANRWGRLPTFLTAVRESAAVIVISDAARDAIWRWLGVRARVVRPGVDLTRFTIGDRRAEAPTFVCPSDLSDARKQPQLLFDAFAQVRRQRPDARLVVHGHGGGGDGIERRDLDDHEELRRTYQEATGTVLASHDEAFGLVLVESLACGTPVVASDDAAAPEIIDDDGIGRLFGGDDPAVLARAMLALLELQDDPATRAACRAKAEEHSLEAFAEAQLAVYRDVLGS